MKPNKNTKYKNLKGKLLVIEGADGSGKGTQVTLLIKALKAARVPVAVFDFPQYESSIFGKLVGRALKGEFGDFRHMSPFMTSLPYTLDRVLAKDVIKKALKKGVVICNRYTPSNVAYQAAKCTGNARREVISFLEEAEYKALGLPRPNLVMYLYVPPATSFRLIADKNARGYLGAKKGARDQHEMDRAYQCAVVKVYQTLTSERSDWKLINCAQRGRMLSREAIHELVVNTCLGL